MMEVFYCVGGKASEMRKEIKNRQVYLYKNGRHIFVAFKGNRISAL